MWSEAVHCALGRTWGARSSIVMGSCVVIESIIA